MPEENEKRILQTFIYLSENALVLDLVSLVFSSKSLANANIFCRVSTSKMSLKVS